MPKGAKYLLNSTIILYDLHSDVTPTKKIRAHGFTLHRNILNLADIDKEYIYNYKDNVYLYVLALRKLFEYS